jgi:pilus assembly protein Flp/PilA
MIQNAIDSFTSWTSGLTRRVRRDEEGATMVEYGLIVAAIAMVVVIAALALGGGISTLFGNANTCVQNANATNC